MTRCARRIVNSLPATVAVDALVWAFQLRRIARKARA